MTSLLGTRYECPLVFGKHRTPGSASAEAGLSGCGELTPEAVSHGVHVRPAEAASAEEHVANQRFYRRLADQSDEEQLLDHLHNTQGRQHNEDK